MTKVTNRIWDGNRFLNHRKFVAFLDEVSAAYGDLQMHPEVRWMSWGKCLEHRNPSVFAGQRWMWYKSFTDRDFLCDMPSLRVSLHILITWTCSCREGDKLCQIFTQTWPHFYVKCSKKGISIVCPNLTHFPTCEVMCKYVLKCEKTFHKYRASKLCSN